MLLKRIEIGNAVHDELCCYANSEMRTARKTLRARVKVNIYVCLNAAYVFCVCVGGGGVLQDRV